MKRVQRWVWTSITMMGVLGGGVAGCSSTDNPKPDNNRGGQTNAGTAGTGASSGGSEGGNGGNNNGGAGSSNGGSSNGGAGSSNDCPSIPPPPPCTGTDIQTRLGCIPGLNATLNNQNPGTDRTRFDITFEQPVDHKNPSGEKFLQRMTLMHVGEKAPTLVYINGYQLPANPSLGGEIARGTVPMNVLSLEYRFYGRSLPTGGIAWPYLNTWQAAQDFHRIVGALHWIYPGKWLSSGASKGGATVLSYRQHFPCEVDATIAYVAPVLFDTHDARFSEFLATVGGPPHSTCRERFRAAQTAVLQRRAEIEAQMEESDFTLLGKELALEQWVTEVYFGFWQYQDPATCENYVPLPDAAAEDLFLFAEKGDGNMGGDAGIRAFRQFNFQAATEMGYYAPDNAHLSALLKHPTRNTIESLMLPEMGEVRFDPASSKTLHTWVKTEAQRVLLIYGEFDPWSAAMFDINSDKDSYRFIAPGKNHGSNIGVLRDVDKTKAQSLLRRWLNLPAAATSPNLLPDALRSDEFEAAQAARTAQHQRSRMR